MDWAVATLVDGVEHGGNRIPEGLDCPYEGKILRRSGGYDVLGPEEVVCKVGRTTGSTLGLVSAVALDNVPVWTPQGNVVFDNVLEIRWLADDLPFSLPGDSGSVVFAEAEGDLIAVGLHFARRSDSAGRGRDRPEFCVQSYRRARGLQRRADRRLSAMASMQQVLAAKKQATKLLGTTAGIAGIGVGWTASGEPRVRVNIDESMPENERQKIPQQIGGVEIDIQPISRLVFQPAASS